MSIIAKIKGLLTIVTVTLMIAFIAYTSQIFIIWPYLTTTFNLLQTICILVPLNLCIGMLFIHYFLACFTNPGSVPIRYTPRQQAYIEVKKSTHTPRFCKTCDNHKPPRTHHCSVCKRCVLKMDHHCPWVNNCIGYFNYCHFIRFIVFVDISSIYLFVLLCCRTNQIIKNLHNSVMIRSLEIGFLSVNLICLAIVMVTVGVLTGYHVYCITTNTTTIEGWEKGRSLTIKGMGRIQNVKKPYDQGLCKNISAVLGNHPMLWFMPIPMRGTGLDFPISLRYFDEEKQVERPLSVGTLGNDTTLKKMSSHETSSDRPTSFATFVSNTTTLV